MILPIVAYGDAVLRKVCEDLPEDFPKMKELVANMYETMYNANGVGLAAPQIGLPIRVFVIDTTPFADDEDLSADDRMALKGFKQTFINAYVEEETGDEWAFNEGCLSIPEIREDIKRKDTLTLSFVDADLKEHTETYDGLLARVIQHEYDHIEGILFTDKLSPLKKRMLKGKLNNISRGKIEVDYRMRFPNVKKAR